MREIAFREALREALREEMLRDDRVFLMGEEVAEYNGAYKVSQGLLDEFGAKRVICRNAGSPVQGWHTLYLADDNVRSRQGVTCTCRCKI